MRSRFTLPLATLLVAGAVTARAQDAQPADTAAPGARLMAFPFLFYQPETHLGGGAGALRTYRVPGSTKPSAVNLMLVGTTRRQFSISSALERYSRDDAWRVAGELIWSRFPDLFYGVGNATRLEDEEPFTLETRRAYGDVRRAVGRGVYVGAVAGIQKSLLREADSGGMLRSGVTGSNGALLVAAGAVGTIDRRDHLFTPSTGQLATVQVRWTLPALGADLRYSRSELDVRDYRRVGGGVLASQALLTVIDGDPPFFDMATLGGASTLRGYYEARYRDRSRVAGQLEFRRPVWRRLGVAAFGAAGQVARDPGQFRLDDLHFSGGAGLRLLIARAEGINARIDFGFGRRSSGVYFGFGEAF